MCCVHHFPKMCTIQTFRSHKNESHILPSVSESGSDFEIEVEISEDFLCDRKYLNFGRL